jgi:Glycosyltransferase family 87
MTSASSAPRAARAVSLSRWRRPLALGLTVLAAAAIACAFWISISDAPKVGADGYTYLAAGERLNAGHHLYELRPGDRWIWINPPLWTVPLLSPPLIGVLWRPLAALPADGGLVLWQMLTIGTIATTIIALIVRLPIRASLLAIALAVPIGFEMDVANVNGLLLGGYVLSWWLFARRRDWVGVVVALMAAVKIAPVVLAWWLVTQRRWRAVVWFLGGCIGFLAIGILGSSLEMHLRYLSVAGQTVGGANSDLSLTGMGTAIGVPASIAGLLPRAFLVAGGVTIWLLRRRPGLAFVAAVVTAIFGSPVVNFNTLALLMATLAPWAWPMHDTAPAGPDADPAARAPSVLAAGSD